MDASWVDDYRQYLNEDERECMAHIRNNTFDEQPFTDYFSHWDFYIQLLVQYPEKKDWYDASNLGQIAAYYNEQTRTTTCYDVHTGKKGTQSPKYYSSSSTSSETSSSSRKDYSDTFKDYLLIGGGIVIIILLLRGCAHGEAMDIKKAKALANKARVEWMDENYIPTNIEEEVIRPSDYPVRKLTIK